MEQKFEVVTIRRKSDGGGVDILKFLLNNNTGVKIGCCIWGDDISKFEQLIINFNVRFSLYVITY